MQEDGGQVDHAVCSINVGRLCDRDLLAAQRLSHDIQATRQ